MVDVVVEAAAVACSVYVTNELINRMRIRLAQPDYSAEVIKRHVADKKIIMKQRENPQ